MGIPVAAPRAHDVNRSTDFNSPSSAASHKAVGIKAAQMLPNLIPSFIGLL